MQRADSRRFLRSESGANRRVESSEFRRVESSGIRRTESSGIARTQSNGRQDGGNTLPSEAAGLRAHAVPLNMPGPRTHQVARELSGTESSRNSALSFQREASMDQVQGLSAKPRTNPRMQVGSRFRQAVQQSEAEQVAFADLTGLDPYMSSVISTAKQHNDVVRTMLAHSRKTLKEIRQVTNALQMGNLTVGDLVQAEKYIHRSWNGEIQRLADRKTFTDESLRRCKAMLATEIEDSKLNDIVSTTCAVELRNTRRILTAADKIAGSLTQIKTLAADMISQETLDNMQEVPEWVHSIKTVSDREITRMLAGQRNHRDRRRSSVSKADLPIEQEVAAGSGEPGQIDKGPFTVPPPRPLYNPAAAPVASISVPEALGRSLLHDMLLPSADPNLSEHRHIDFRHSGQPEAAMAKAPSRRISDAGSATSRKQVPSPPGPVEWTLLSSSPLIDEEEWNALERSRRASAEAAELTITEEKVAEPEPEEGVVSEPQPAAVPVPQPEPEEWETVTKLLNAATPDIDLLKNVAHAARGSNGSLAILLSNALSPEHRQPSPAALRMFPSPPPSSVSTTPPPAAPRPASLVRPAKKDLWWASSEWEPDETQRWGRNRWRGEVTQGEIHGSTARFPLTTIARVYPPATPAQPQRLRREATAESEKKRRGMFPRDSQFVVPRGAPAQRKALASATCGPSFHLARSALFRPPPQPRSQSVPLENRPPPGGRTSALSRLAAEAGVDLQSLRQARVRSPVPPALAADDHPLPALRLACGPRSRAPTSQRLLRECQSLSLARGVRIASSDLADLARAAPRNHQLQDRHLSLSVPLYQRLAPPTNRAPRPASLSSPFAVSWSLSHTPPSATGGIHSREGPPPMWGMGGTAETMQIDGSDVPWPAASVRERRVESLTIAEDEEADDVESDGELQEDEGHAGHEYWGEGSGENLDHAQEEDGDFEQQGEGASVSGTAFPAGGEETSAAPPPAPTVQAVAEALEAALPRGGGHRSRSPHSRRAASSTRSLSESHATSRSPRRAPPIASPAASSSQLTSSARSPELGTSRIASPTSSATAVDSSREPSPPPQHPRRRSSAYAADTVSPAGAQEHGRRRRRSSAYGGGAVTVSWSEREAIEEEADAAAVSHLAALSEMTALRPFGGVKEGTAPAARKAAGPLRFPAGPGTSLRAQAAKGGAGQREEGAKAGRKAGAAGSPIASFRGGPAPSTDGAGMGGHGDPAHDGLSGWELDDGPGLPRSGRETPQAVPVDTDEVPALLVPYPGRKQTKLQ